MYIENGKTGYFPVVTDDVTWDTERQGVPSKLSFTVVKDETLQIEEGNAVRLKVDGFNVFFGFIFTIKTSKNKTLTITAYDQLRYLKNKDTFVYANRTASSLVHMLASDFRLNIGTIDNTGYVIASRIEDNKTLFDVIQNALDETITNTKRMYVLYDDFGKLCLRDAEYLKIGILIDEETGENFDYSSSIDGETYNKIKLARENPDTGKRDIFIAQDGDSMNRWGILQYFEKLEGGTNPEAKANALLGLYNHKVKNLKITKALGDLRVRAGFSIGVKLNLGDVNVANFMLVERVKHTFSNSQHLMDLTLRGGDFSA